MHVWGWNEDGERTHNITPFKPFMYIEGKSDVPAKSIYNTDLRKIEFKNTWDRNKYIKQTGLTRIFYNLRPEQQFLIDQYGGLNNTTEFKKHQLDIGFVDIEVYTCKYPLSTELKFRDNNGEEYEDIISNILDRDDLDVVWDVENVKWTKLDTSCYTQTSEFPKAEEAKYPINVITLYSTLSKQFMTWGLDRDYTPTQDNVTYINCKTEGQLLEKFLDYWTKNTPDLLSGWNSEQFDLPYIINRITNVLGETAAKRMSPVNSIYYRQGIASVFGRDVGKWLVSGVTCIDYMDAYKKFCRGERPSYSLNNIAELELGEGKIKFNATDLSKLAITDWKKFIDYNIQDVNLLVQLEEKLQYINLVRTIAYKGMSTLESAMGTLSVVTGALAQKALEQDMIIPTFRHSSTGSYEGGFVMEPRAGLQENVVSFDANSLYPNTIITLNISPETKLGKITDKTAETITFQLTDGKFITLSHAKFGQFIKQSNACVSKAKIIYSQNQKGFCPHVIEGIYQERVETKETLTKARRREVRLQRELKKSPDDVSIKAKIDSTNHEIDQLDIYQLALKIFLNSIYGTFANKHSPFYDIDAAASITLTGQACVKESSVIIQRYAKEVYDIDEELPIYSDTDSCYFTITPILNHLNIDLLDDKTVTSEAIEETERIEEYLNEGITTWAQKTLNTTDSRFVFKREAIADVGLFLMKKRYILNVRNDEGIEVNKRKYVGVEVARSSFSDPVKDIIKSIVGTIFETKSQSAVNTAYRAGFDKFKTLSRDDIAIRVSIKDYDKYASQSTDFNIALRTPIHVKGSIYYNNLLKQHNLTNDYENITSGDKVKWFYTDNNKYQIKVLSYSDVIPPEIDAVVTPDYKKMFDKLVTSSIERMFEACGWQLDDLTYSYSTNLQDFFS